MGAWIQDGEYAYGEYVDGKKEPKKEPKNMEPKKDPTKEPKDHIRSYFLGW